MSAVTESDFQHCSKRNQVILDLHLNLNCCIKPAKTQAQNYKRKSWIRICGPSIQSWSLSNRKPSTKWCFCENQSLIINRKTAKKYIPDLYIWSYILFWCSMLSLTCKWTHSLPLTIYFQFYLVSFIKTLLSYEHVLLVRNVDTYTHIWK